MKQFLHSLVLFFCLLMILSKGVFAAEEKGFYSSIADNIGSRENKMYPLELAGKLGTKEKLRRIGGKDYLKADYTAEDIQKIVNTGDVNLILDNIKDEYKNENGSINKQTVQNIFSAVNTLNNQAAESTQEKRKQITNFEKTGVYADGNNENSPFDLMTDLENINKVWFEDDLELQIEQSVNIDATLDEKIENSALSEKEKRKAQEVQDLLGGMENVICKVDGTCDEPKDPALEVCKNGQNCSGIYDSESPVSDLECINPNASGLNQFNNKNINSILDQKLNRFDQEQFSKADLLSIAEEEVPNPEGNYLNINDNHVFPCNEYFCIEISYDTGQYGLVGGWKRKDPSIEYLVGRSNGHLKKFANTSMVQSKMTINNFELGLKDIELSEMFHMHMYVSWLPVPILELNKDVSNNSESIEEEKTGPYTVENLQKKYYKNLGLDYERRNDLSFYSQVAIDKKIALNSKGNMNLKMIQRNRQIQSLITKGEAKNKEITKHLEQDAKINPNKNLEQQFKELERFGVNFNTQINTLDSILDQMLEIPVDSSVN